MGAKLSVTKSHRLGNIAFSEQRNVEADAAIVQEKSIAAAEDGDLTTRTSDSVGTITMSASGHSVQTGDIIDLYWTGGQRRNVTVGTVSGASVPITGGAGDNLPAQDTNLAVKVREELDISVVGTNVKGIILATESRGTFFFAGADDAEDWAKVVGAGLAIIWTDDNELESANPITGDTIAKVWVSHDNKTKAQTMKVGILYNNA